ncbi:hypothetical protein FDP41_002326 [Naegleria fowleri]|uniref:UDP-glycosyltransferases domain-containing protein n=1 Tax=Naegleria fowleri TaxID=5763 RepID=A0A6A5BTH8_NAEFO|nr:uncharacterized protein FDP41_002326 [Naegleria fowleri]KAF0978506.1 hypothetical protein FDP41_002326 [Naegleria fowleri]CAG4719068.1 unnamed protein product [Naegleria fowleri]
MSQFNQARARYGIPPSSQPFIEPVDKLTIHLTLQGNFEYSYPVPNTHKFVGYNYIEKSMSSKPKFSQMTLDTSQDPSKSEEIKWLDEQASNNQTVIYIAFGTKVKVSSHHLQTILQSIFSQPQRPSVLLASSNFKMDEILSEWRHKLFIKPWVAQVHVLRHLSVAMFITHGGSHSIFESVQSQVPLLIMPIFGDQHLNAIRAEDIGIARIIHTEDELELSENIAFILEHSSHIKRKMRRVKEMNRDVAALPMDPDLLKQFLNYEEISSLSSASVAAASLIRQVFLFGSEHLISVENKLSYIEKVRPIHVLLLFVVSPVVIVILIRRRLNQDKK